jgi:hypothetical protein
MMDPESTIESGLTERTELETGGPSENEKRSGAVAPRESQSLAIELFHQQKQSKRKAAGPQTRLGKETSSRNSTKHGLFSKLLLLPGESPAEIKKLWAGLRDYHRPEGVQEESAVEELVHIEVCMKRLRLAEWAEIQKNMKTFEWDQQNPRPVETEKNGRLTVASINYGMIQKIHDPDAVNCCLEILRILHRQIKDRGFNPEEDTHLLEKIFGERIEDHMRTDLYDIYLGYLRVTEMPEEERLREGCPSPEQCRRDVVKYIKKKINWLERYREERASFEAERQHFEILSRSVLDGPALDRFNRYEKRLRLARERTLNQLERLKRMRRGQTVLPKT